MAGTEKLLDKILSGKSDANIRFNGMLQIREKMGFEGRILGSHHIFSRDGKSLALQ